MLPQIHVFLYPSAAVADILQIPKGGNHTKIIKRKRNLTVSLEDDFMKKWIIGFAILWCLLLASYQSATSQVIVVWTERGCNATYNPGEMVKIHYRVYERGWTRVFKQYPDTHEEEIAGWKYFPTGGEYVEIDTLGPECARITYTVTFWQEIGAGCSGCLPCYGCGPSVVYVMEFGRDMCSINVQCDMKASLFTDKVEYTASIDSEAKITLNTTNIYGSPLDADSIVLDVNGEGVTAIKSSAGIYTASFTLSGRSQGEYTVTASIFKRNYPQLVKTTKFTLIIPVSIHLSTDNPVYAPGGQAAVRAEVRDRAGNGVSGLQFELSVSGSGKSVPFADLGGGIYEAQIDLSGFEQGQYVADIAGMEEYVHIDSVRKAEFTVGGLPTIVTDVPSEAEITAGSTEDISFVLKNTGDGEAVNITVSVQASPGIDVMAVSGYAHTLPSGDQTTGVLSLAGRDTGVYTVTTETSYQDAGEGVHTTSGSFPVTVTSGMGLVLVAGVAAATALGAAAYLLKGRAGTKAVEEGSKPGQKIAQKASQKGTQAAEAATKKTGTQAAEAATKNSGTKVAEAATKNPGTKVAEAASKTRGANLSSEAVAGGGVLGGVVKKPEVCKKCGFKNSPDSTFCSQCGEEL